MHVSSIGATALPALGTGAKQLESAETQKIGRDNDGDADDASAAPAPVGPTVNMSGQKVGQIISVTA
jgi:hypothetical protein